MNLINKTYHHHKISFLLFLTVGVFSALINFGSFAFLWRALNVDYRISVSIAYVLSVIVHFAGNRYVTFKSHHDPVSRQMPRYLAMVALNYFVTISVVQLAVEVLHYSPTIGIAWGIASTVAAGYLLSRWWVFKAERKCDIL